MKTIGTPLPLMQSKLLTRINVSHLGKYKYMYMGYIQSITLLYNRSLVRHKSSYHQILMTDEPKSYTCLFLG